MGYDPEYDLVRAELQTKVLTSRRGSAAFKRREENVEWIRELILSDLEYNNVEMQIRMARTDRGEEVVIQYPGKESLQGQRSWKNEWDFRPKILKVDNVDLTFAQLWDPLFDDLRSLNAAARREVGTALATMFYRMAYMIDYEKEPGSDYIAKPIRIGDSLVTRDLPNIQKLGPFWKYKPPFKAMEMISRHLRTWAGMSLEAFLHYNSLLAWNEDCKVRAKYPKWTPAKKTGRINTLLTHIRVIGFILDEVRPSTLLGGFASGRGMSPATTKEVEKVCSGYVSH